jgi:glutamine cyclotransferase
VLNGIAAVPGTDEFLVTGKYWPTMYRVKFVPATT